MAWELSYILDNVPKEKLIIVAHPQLLSMESGQKRMEWSLFQSVLGSLFPSRLPQSLGNAYLFYFDGGGQVRAAIPNSPPVLSFGQCERNLSSAIDRTFSDKAIYDSVVFLARKRRRRIAGWFMAAEGIVGVLGLCTGSGRLFAAGLITFLVTVTYYAIFTRKPPIIEGADSR